MKLSKTNLKDHAILAAKLLGIIIGAAIFWIVVIDFMWACAEAGIRM